MAYAKEERNRRFLEDWQVHNLNNEQLAEKYGLSIGGTKALKARLREKDRSSRGQKEKSSPVGDQKVASTSTSTSTNPSRETKRMTFWLPKGTIDKIKARAEGQRETASQFLREFLDKYLK